MHITPQVREIIDYAQRKIKRVAKEDISLYPVPKEKAAWFTWEQLCIVVCCVCNVELDRVMSHWRKREVVLARHLIWYYGMQYKMGTLSVLGIRVADNDHTTVMHGVQKIKDLLETGDEIAYDAVKRIDQLLNNMKPAEPVDIPF